MIFMCWDIKHFIDSNGARCNGYNIISLSDISSVVSNILWYQLIPNTEDVRMMLIYDNIIQDVLTVSYFTHLWAEFVHRPSVE